MTIKEFTFPGGRLREDGKIIVDPGVKVEKDPTTRKIFLRPVGGAGSISVDCVCISGGGECWADDFGGNVISCASVDPCEQCVIVVLADNFTLKAAVASVRKQ